ncbi:MAG: LysE family transporter [Rhodospirillales bacterium]|nr:LysE family transporter [Rhodospirillales bacterium]
MELLAGLPVYPAVLAAFIIAGGAIVLSPGPDKLLIIRYTMSSGAAVGISTVAGVQAGLLAHTVLAILGLSNVIASSALLFSEHRHCRCGLSRLAWVP